MLRMLRVPVMRMVRRQDLNPMFQSDENSSGSERQEARLSRQGGLPLFGALGLDVTAEDTSTR